MSQQDRTPPSMAIHTLILANNLPNTSKEQFVAISMTLGGLADVRATSLSLTKKQKGKFGICSKNKNTS